MPHNYITHSEEAGRTTFAYTPRLPWWTPRVWAWCALGGVAIGIVAGTVAAGGNVWSFGRVALLSTLVGALGLYALVRLTARPMAALFVTFDLLERTVQVRSRHLRAPARYALDEVVGFRVEQRAAGWRGGCVLVMETAAHGTLELLLAGRECYRREALPALLLRLNEQLALMASEWQRQHEGRGAMP